MGYPTKIQLIKRTASEQWYINFPSAVAQAMEFEKGEIVEWTIENKQRMILKRSDSKSESKLESEKKNSKQINNR
jgi:antitoxin component of MazEF toxin-antitoxin module